MAFGEVGLQVTQAVVCQLASALQRVEQEKVIPGFVHLGVVGIVVQEPQQVLLAQWQVGEFVFEDDACVEQPVLDDVVGGGLLFVGKGNLCQIVFAVVRVVGE